MMILVCGPIRRNSRSIADFVIETHPAVGRKIRARQMQKHRAAAAGDARGGVVVDLDDEIVEMVFAGQPVAGLAVAEPDRLIVMAVVRVLAPGVFGPDRRGPAGRSAAAGGGRRATIIAGGGRCPSGCRHRLRACWRGCRRGQVPPGRSSRRRSASPGGGRRRRGWTRIAESGRSRAICLISD